MHWAIHMHMNVLTEFTFGTKRLPFASTKTLTIILEVNSENQAIPLPGVEPGKFKLWSKGFMKQPFRLKRLAVNFFFSSAASLLSAFNSSLLVQNVPPHPATAAYLSSVSFYHHKAPGMKPNEP